MNNEAGMSFAGVLAAEDHDHWLVLVLLVLIRDLEHWHVDAAIRLANAAEFDEVERRCLGYVSDLLDMTLHLCIRIWYGVRYVDLVVFVIELEVEAHSIIRLGLMWIHLVDFLVVNRDVVVHVEAAVEPTLAILLVAS